MMNSKRMILIASSLLILFGCHESKDEAVEGEGTLVFEHVVDLTHTLDADFPFIPHEVTFPFELRPLATIEKDYVAANEWKIHEHIGTQVDAPSHFAADGGGLETLDAKDLVVPAVVVDISARAATDINTELEVKDIEQWEAEHGRIPERACVFMYSGWEQHLTTPKFIGLDAAGTKHFPGISLAAAEFLLKERAISGVGVDVLSFDPGYDNEYKTHRAILGADKWALECVANLAQLPPRGATVFVGAPKVAGATGGPVRIIAVW